MKTIAEQRLHHVETRKMLRVNPVITRKEILARLMEGDVESLLQHRSDLIREAAHSHDSSEVGRLTKMTEIVEEAITTKSAYDLDSNFAMAALRLLKRHHDQAVFHARHDGGVRIVFWEPRSSDLDHDLKVLADHMGIQMSQSRPRTLDFDW